MRQHYLNQLPPLEASAPDSDHEEAHDIPAAAAPERQQYLLTEAQLERYEDSLAGSLPIQRAFQILGGGETEGDEAVYNPGAAGSTAAQEYQTARQLPHVAGAQPFNAAAALQTHYNYLMAALSMLDAPQAHAPEYFHDTMNYVALLQSTYEKFAANVGRLIQNIGKRAPIYSRQRYGNYGSIASDQLLASDTIGQFCEDIIAAHDDTKKGHHPTTEEGYFTQLHQIHIQHLSRMLSSASTADARNVINYLRNFQTLLGNFAYYQPQLVSDLRTHPAINDVCVDIQNKVTARRELQDDTILLTCWALFPTLFCTVPINLTRAAVSPAVEVLNFAFYCLCCGACDDNSLYYDCTPHGRSTEFHSVICTDKCWFGDASLFCHEPKKDANGFCSPLSARKVNQAELTRLEESDGLGEHPGPTVQAMN